MSATTVHEVTYKGPGGSFTIHRNAPDRFVMRVVGAAMGTGTLIDVTAAHSEREIGSGRTAAHDATDVLLWGCSPRAGWIDPEVPR